MQTATRRTPTLGLLALLLAAGLLLLAGAARADTAQDYVVVLEPGVSLHRAVAAQEAAGNDVSKTFSHGIDGFVAHLTPAEATALRAQDATAIVERDRVMTIAAAPANDPISGAQSLAASGSLAASTLEATRESGEPAHAGRPNSASIWYRWVAPSNGRLDVATAGSDFDTVLALYGGYAGTWASLTTLAANDDVAWPTDASSSVGSTVTGGTAYWVAVDGYRSAKGGVALSWSFTPDVTTVPDAPTGVSTISGNGRLTITWAAPAATGGSPILDYTATATPGGRTCTSSAATTCTITGLTNGASYTVSVTARNAIGTSAASASSPPTKPSAVGSSRDAATPAWGVDRLDQRALPLDGRIVQSAIGTGVTAYVIDTGVRPDHQELAGRTGAGYTSVADGNGTNDCNGHGTHVAGTIGGTTLGVAPGAAIVPVRVLDCAGSGSYSSVIAGIDWAIANHPAGLPAVANMSLGGGFSAAVNAAVAAATADGITMVVAAGNSDTDACGSSPASEPSAITVGATDATDARAWFSNFGSCVDVFAPGVSILSASPASTTATATLSGTSMASPHAAGVVAVLLSLGITNSNVVNTLVGNATPSVVGDARPGSPNRLLSLASTTPFVDTPPVVSPVEPPVTTPPDTTPPKASPATLSRVRVVFRALRGRPNRGNYIVSGQASHAGTLRISLSRTTGVLGKATTKGRRGLATRAVLSYAVPAGPFSVATTPNVRGATIQLLYAPSDTTLTPIITNPVIERVIQGTQTHLPAKNRTAS